MKTISRLKMIKIKGKQNPVLNRGKITISRLKMIKRKAKSIAKQREDNNQQVKDDQTLRKNSSRLIQREIDTRK